MEKSKDPQIKLIQRSLDNLKSVIKQNEISSSLPALCYSARLLLRYAESIEIPQQQQQNIKIQNQQHFKIFKNILEEFIKKDLPSFRKNQAQILDQVHSCISNPSFQHFLRADIEYIKKTHRMTYKQINDRQNHQDDDLVLASNRSFHIPRQELQQGLRNSRIKTASSMIFEQQKNPSFYKQLKLDLKQQSMKQIPLKQSMKKTPNKQQLLQQQLSQIWKQVQRHYLDHNIDQAYTKTQQYLQKFKQVEKIPQQKITKIKTIQLQYNTMIGFHRQFQQDGWVHDKTEKGISLQYKIFQQEKQIAIRINCECNVPIENFLAIISEIDLMQEYVPFCYDSRQMKTISRNQKIGTSKIYIPLLTDRETYFYAAGYNRMSTNKSIFLFSKTINEDKLYQDKYQFKVPEKTNLVRLQYKFFIVEYTPITKQSAKIRLASKVDMKLNFLPQFILHKSARTFAFDYFKNIIKKSDKFKGSAWQQKMNKNPDLYKFFRQQVNQFFK